MRQSAVLAVAAMALFGSLAPNAVGFVTRPSAATTNYKYSLPSSTCSSSRPFAAKPLFAKKNELLIQKLQEDISAAQAQRWQIEMEILDLQQSAAEKKALLDSVDAQVIEKQQKLEKAEAAASAKAGGAGGLSNLAAGNVNLASAAGFLAVPVVGLVAGRAALQQREKMQLEAKKKAEEERKRLEAQKKTDQPGGNVVGA